MRYADNFTWKQTSAAQACQVRVLILVCWRQVGAQKWISNYKLVNWQDLVYHNKGIFQVSSLNIENFERNMRFPFLSPPISRPHPRTNYSVCPVSVASSFSELATLFLLCLSCVFQVYVRIFHCCYVIMFVHVRPLEGNITWILIRDACWHPDPMFPCGVPPIIREKYTGDTTWRII